MTEQHEIPLGASVGESPDNNAIVSGNNPPNEPETPTGLVDPQGNPVRAHEEFTPASVMRKLRRSLGYVPQRAKIANLEAIAMIDQLVQKLVEAMGVAQVHYQRAQALERELAARKSPKQPDVTITRVPDDAE